MSGKYGLCGLELRTDNLVGWSNGGTTWAWVLDSNGNMEGNMVRRKWPTIPCTTFLSRASQFSAKKSPLDCHSSPGHQV